MQRRHLSALLGMVALAGCAGAARAPVAAPAGGSFTARDASLPMRFEVVGRGPITRTHTSDLSVFRGRNGRDYAYVSTWGACEGCYGDRMYVFDVTNPQKPVLTDSVMVDARIVNDVTVNREGTLASVTREGASSRRNGIVILDLADPAHPRVASEYWETLTGGVHNSVIDGSFIYATHNGTGDLHIIDASNVREPRQVARWGVPAGLGSKYLHDVWVEGGLAYLAYWDDGLIILDVGRGIKGGSPHAPKFVGQYRYKTQWRGRSYGQTHAVFPYTNRAGHKFVIVGDEIFPDDADRLLQRRRPVVPGGYIHLVDVSNLEQPVEVAKYEVASAGAHNIWVANDTMFVAYYNGGLRAVDISGDPRGELRGTARELAALPTTDAQAFTPDDPFTMAPQYYRGLIYAVDFNTGLWVTRLVPNRPAAAAGSP